MLRGSNGPNTARIVIKSKMYFKLWAWWNRCFPIFVEVSPSVKVWHDVWWQCCAFASSFTSKKSLDFSDLQWQIMAVARQGKDITAEDVAIVGTSIYQARKMKWWEHLTLTAGGCRKSIVKKMSLSKAGLEISSIMQHISSEKSICFNQC